MKLVPNRKEKNTVSEFEYNALIAGLREAAAKAKQIEAGSHIGYLLQTDED